MKTKMGRLVIGMLAGILMVCVVATANAASFTVQATKDVRVILTQLYPGPSIEIDDYISDGTPQVFIPLSADPVLGTQVRLEANAYFITGIWGWHEASVWVRNDGTLIFPATPDPLWSIQDGTLLYLYGAFTVQATEDVRVILTQLYPDPDVEFADYISDGMPQVFVPRSTDPVIGTLVKLEANAYTITGIWRWDEAPVWVGNNGTLTFATTPHPWWSIQGGTILYAIVEEPEYTFTLIAGADHIIWTASTGNWGFGEDGAIFKQVSLPNGSYSVQGNAYALTGVWEWDNATVIVDDGQISLMEGLAQEFIQLTDTVIVYAGALTRHGQFVSTVSEAVEDLMACVELGDCEDPQETEGEIVSTAAKSTFGMPPRSQKPGNK